MSEYIGHNCGVAAIALKNGGNVLERGYDTISRLQKRGEDGGGFTTYNPERTEKTLSTHKDKGSVNTIFRKSNSYYHSRLLREFAGDRAIFHLRYTTSASDDKAYLQPEFRESQRKDESCALSFNGNIANCCSLKEELDSKEFLEQKTDTAVFATLIGIELAKTERRDAIGFAQIFQGVAKKLDGAYSFAFIDGNGRIVVGRDPYGFRPLWYANNDEIFAAASEDIALDVLGFKREEMAEVEPGSLVIFDSSRNSKVSEVRFAESERHTACMFEHVYFSQGASRGFRGMPIDLFRYYLGEELAKSDPLKEKFESGELIREDFVVVPVPDTSRHAAIAYAETLGLRLREGLQKIESDMPRNFILPKSEREVPMRIKYVVHPNTISRFNIIAIDDSVIRGDTSIQITSLLREYADVKSVHLRITNPQTKWSCFYGIDKHLFGESEGGERTIELTAAKFSNLTDEEREITIATEIGADSLHYQTLEGLVKAHERASNGEVNKENLCLACLTGEYPTPIGRFLHEQERKALDEGLNLGRRAYEVVQR